MCLYASFSETFNSISSIVKDGYYRSYIGSYKIRIHSFMKLFFEVCNIFFYVASFIIGEIIIVL